MGNQPSIATSTNTTGEPSAGLPRPTITSSYFEPTTTVPRQYPQAQSQQSHPRPTPPQDSNVIFVEKARSSQTLTSPIQSYYQLQPNQFISSDPLPPPQKPQRREEPQRGDDMVGGSRSTPNAPSSVNPINPNRYAEYTGLKPTERNVINTNRIDIEQIDPFGLLDNTRSLTLVQLAKAYVSLRNIHHPDKGGEHERFIQIMDALKTIKWIDQMTQSDKTYLDLKKNFTDTIKTEYSNSFSTPDGHRGDEIPDKFKRMTNDKFNRLFEENRYRDDDEDGYGEYMEKSNGKREDIEVPRTMTRYKPAEFHKEFSRSKHSQKGESKELIKYQVPESLHSGNLGYVVLGDAKQKKYTGSTGGLQYTDYMDAYTKDNVLVDDAELPTHLQRRIRQKNLQKALTEYKRADMNLTDEQQEAIEKYEKKKERTEYLREERFRDQVRQYDKYDKTIRNRIGY